MNLNIQKEPFSGKDQAVKNSIPESDGVRNSARSSSELWALIETSWAADAWFVLCMILSSALRTYHHES